MVQLELDPVLLEPDRATEINVSRKSILRKIVSTNRFNDHREYQVVYLEDALSALLKRAQSRFSKIKGILADDLDLLINGSLRFSLPFLYGVRGRFNSFNHFRETKFEQRLHHAIIGWHRIQNSQKDEEATITSTSKVKRPRAEGFQPPLFGSERMRQALSEDISSQLIEDLNDPDRVLMGGSSKKRGYRQEAQQLLLAGFSNSYVLWYLRNEGLVDFPPSTVRVWNTRVNKAENLVKSKVS